MKSDLSDDLLRAIGAVSAQWAVLEYQMSRATVACLTKFSNDPSKGVAALNKLSFAARRGLFEDALNGPDVTPSVKIEGSKLLARIKGIENERHKIVHGMAEELDPIHPEILFSRTMGELWFSERFTVADIEAIADRIGDLHLEILGFAAKLWPPIAE
jgi:hypothetical protein